MPHYYFHLVGADGLYSRDEQGVSFDTVDDAYMDLHKSVLEISFEMLRQRKDPFRYRFEVADQFGTVLLDVPFAEVLRPNNPTRNTLTDAFYASVKHEMKRSRALKDDLSNQIALAHATIEATRRLLAKPRPAALAG